MNSNVPSVDSTHTAFDPHAGTVPLPQTAPMPARRGFSWQRFGGKFLVISVLAHLLFGAVAAYLVVQTIQAKRKLDFKSGPKGPTASTRSLEHQVQMKKQKNALSAPPQAKRVTTTGLAKVALPDMPAMPSMSAALSPGAISGMGAAGLSPGGLGGGVGGMGGSGGAAINFFGVRTGGAGLAGTFYDLKQTQSRQPTNMTPDMYGKILIDFANGGFNAGLLARFYKADKPVYATQIWIPNISADLGPAAFGLEKIVQPKMWCVHYKGRVTPPESFTFHFVGAGDDIMQVKFNGKLVLDRSWYARTNWKPVANYDYGFSGIKNGFAKGDAIQVQAGQSYPMEVMIGEQPGGYDFATLLQEIEGVQYDKDKKGNPILPVFRMSNAKPASGADGKPYPPHRDDGPVWKAEPATANNSSSFFDR